MSETYSKPETAKWLIMNIGVGLGWTWEYKKNPGVLHSRPGVYVYVNLVRVRRRQALCQDEAQAQIFAVTSSITVLLST